MPDGPVVGAAQLGRRLGVSAPVIRRAAALGQLPGRKIGKQLLFALEAVRLEMGRRQQAPAAAAGPAGSVPRR